MSAGDPSGSLDRLRQDWPPQPDWAPLQEAIRADPWNYERYRDFSDRQGEYIALLEAALRLCRHNLLHYGCHRMSCGAPDAPCSCGWSSKLEQLASIPRPEANQT